MVWNNIHVTRLPNNLGSQDPEGGEPEHQQKNIQSEDGPVVINFWGRKVGDEVVG